MSVHSLPARSPVRWVTARRSPKDGILPRQQSSGGKERLLGISKRGDGYLRKLLVHGARAVLRHIKDRDDALNGARTALRHVKDRDDALSQWINTLTAREPINVATVALANKTARVAWAILRNDTAYDPVFAAGNQAG